MQLFQWCWLLSLLAAAAGQFNTNQQFGVQQSNTDHYAQKDAVGASGNSLNRFRTNQNIATNQAGFRSGLTQSASNNPFVQAAALQRQNNGNSYVESPQQGTLRTGGNSNFRTNTFRRVPIQPGQFGSTSQRTGQFGTNVAEQYSANNIATSQSSNSFNNLRNIASQFNRNLASIRTGSQSLDPPIAILTQQSENDGLGSYKFAFSTANGISREEEGQPQGLDSYAVRGSYSYTSPEGVEVLVNYVADENGFQVDSPNVPAIPEHSRQQLLAAEEARRLGVPNQDGSYREPQQSFQNTNRNFANQNSNFRTSSSANNLRSPFGTTNHRTHSSAFGSNPTQRTQLGSTGHFGAQSQLGGNPNAFGLNTNQRIQHGSTGVFGTRSNLGGTSNTLGLNANQRTQLGSTGYFGAQSQLGGNPNAFGLNTNQRTQHGSTGVFGTRSNLGGTSNTLGLDANQRTQLGSTGHFGAQSQLGGNPNAFGLNANQRTQFGSTGQFGTHSNLVGTRNAFGLNANQRTQLGTQSNFGTNSPQQFGSQQQRTATGGYT